VTPLSWVRIPAVTPKRIRSGDPDLADQVIDGLPGAVDR
jgi:hypothetical protein